MRQFKYLFLALTASALALAAGEREKQVLELPHLSSFPSGEGMKGGTQRRPWERAVKAAQRVPAGRGRRCRPC
jgi:hypothetical protein